MAMFMPDDTRWAQHYPEFCSKRRTPSNTPVKTHADIANWSNK